MFFPVTQECTPNEMIFTIRTNEGFNGRIYTFKHFDRSPCFVRGNGGKNHRLVSRLHITCGIILWTQKRPFMCFEKRSLIKQQGKFVEKFSELMKNLSDMPKLETFVFITKIHQNIPVSIALVSFIKPKALHRVL